METAERKYRDTPKESKKYTGRLTQYIKLLISSERFIEANHFFYFLNEEKPHHPSTIRLGYELAIAMFDSERVRYFDNIFPKGVSYRNELVWFRLKYYLSVNSKVNCEQCCIFLLSGDAKKEYLPVIIESCINLKSYVIASAVIKYFNKENLALTSAGGNEVKKIVVQRLVDNLQRLIHG